MYSKCLFLAGSDPYNYFNLDVSSGDLSLGRTVDYDDLVSRGITTTFTLTLEARDSGLPQRMSTIMVTVEITDDDASPPRCSPTSPISVTLSEHPLAVTNDVVS